MTASIPRIQRVSDSEVKIAAAREVAFEQVIAAAEKVGTVKRRDPDKNFVDAGMRYGLQSVALRISLVERDPGETAVVIQGSSDDVWGAGARNAAGRLVQMLVNLDNPGFAADRLGVNPVALVGAIAGFVIVLIYVMKQLGVR